MTDSEIRTRGAAVLADALGYVEAERFITLILREPFDYTKWRQSLFEDKEIDQISSAAAMLRLTQKDMLSTAV